MSGAQAKTAKLSMAGMKTRIGGRPKRRLSLACGWRTSFWISLIASATGLEEAERADAVGAAGAPVCGR